MANGLTPPINIELFWFLLLLFVVLIFFFIVGTIISTFKSRITGVVILFTTWFILLFAIQAALNYYIAFKASAIKPVEQLEMAKLNILSDFEKRAIENSITYRYGEKLTQPVKDTVLSYWYNEFKQIQSLEDNMITEMNKVTSYYHILSILFPTTNYFSLSNEISSMGYFNLIDFYQYVQKSKQEFVKFYIDKLYFSDLTEFSGVVSFIKGDENIFKGIIRLPATFAWGFLVLLLQISALTWWSYDRFKKLLYHLDQDELKNLEKKIAFNKSQFDIYFEDNSIYTHLLYSAFSGYGKDLLKNGYTGNITVDDSDILNQEPTQVNYMLYICNPHEFPRDIKTGDFINFLTRFLGTPNAEKKALQYEYLTPKDMHKHIGKLQAHQKGELLFTILQLRKSIIYLMGDVCKKMPFEYVSRFKKTMETLAAEGSLVLFINTEMDFPAYRTIDSPLLFHKAKHWKSHVDNRESEKK
ncbi:MAG TPA: hypothetical protein VK186_05800 [Candidatus Deferrimicrobium sp.]|nr:hypothetical protein [Candidatus Deferrimicrobium sp.]